MIVYAPRPGSYADKAIKTMTERGFIGPKKVHSGVLARLIGCPVHSMGKVLEFALRHGAILLERRPHQGNWYSLPLEGEARPPADQATAADGGRVMPPNSVFALGAPPQPMPARRSGAVVSTTLAGRARFALWSDGEIQIDRGRQSMTLAPDESRELAALVTGKSMGVA